MKSQLLERSPRLLVLEDGSRFPGFSFGAEARAEGEVVFNTGMVGYPESFTDPSYRGEILTLTYPMIGNYGVPAANANDDGPPVFESDRVQIAGLIVSEYAERPSHWQAKTSLAEWLAGQGVPALYGVDTRELTKKLRSRGTMRGAIVRDAVGTWVPQPSRHYVAEVSVTKPITYPRGTTRVALVDCGCKNTILHHLLARNLTVIRVPWNCDATTLDVAGIIFSNGPGDPVDNVATIATARKAMALGIPTFGICLGNQIMGLAAGATTFKLKFGHRSQNQPCRLMGTSRCYITSQNHGYAVDPTTLSADWEPWFENTNDGTNEGLRHRSKPFMSVQFHPEATPGPVDTSFLFDEFVAALT